MQRQERQEKNHLGFLQLYNQRVGKIQPLLLGLRMTYINKILLKTILLTFILVPFVYASSEQTATMGKTNVSLTEAWNILTTSSKASKWYLLTGADSVYVLSDNVMVIHHTEQNETIALSLKKSKRKVAEGKFDGGLGSGESESMSGDEEDAWLDKFWKKPAFQLFYWEELIVLDKLKEGVLEEAKQFEEANLLDAAERHYNYAGDKESWLRIRQKQLDKRVLIKNWKSAAQAAFDIGQEEKAKEYAQKAGEQYEMAGDLDNAQWEYIKADNMEKAREMEDLLTKE